MAGAYRSYREVLAQKVAGTLTADTVSGYRRMAETFASAKTTRRRSNHLRSALNLIGQETATFRRFSRQRSRNNLAEFSPLPASGKWRGRAAGIRVRAWTSLLGSSSSKWLGALDRTWLGGLPFGWPTEHRAGPSATKPSPDQRAQPFTRRRTQQRGPRSHADSRPRGRATFPTQEAGKTRPGYFLNVVSKTVGSRGFLAIRLSDAAQMIDRLR